MKRLIKMLTGSLLLMAASAFAQHRIPTIDIVGSDPTGTTCNSDVIEQYNGNLYVCPHGGGTYAPMSAVADATARAAAAAAQTTANSAQSTANAALPANGCTTASGGNLTCAIHDSGGQVYNVKAAPFNAKGDGVTDDTAAITAAHVAACAAGGGTILYPQGTYMIKPSTNPFILCSNITEEGAGKATLRVMSSTGDFEYIWGPALSANTTLQNITFQNFTIDENSVNNTTATPKIPCTGNSYGCYQWIWLFQKTINGAVQGLTIQNMTIYTGGVTAINVTDGLASGQPSTISKDIAITNNHFIFEKRSGVSVFDNSTFYIDAVGQTITGNTFTTLNQAISDGATTAMESHGGPSTITGNTISWYNLGGYIANAPSGSTWTGNVVNDASYGLIIFNSQPVNNVVASGNVINLDNVDRYGVTANTGGIMVQNGLSSPGAIDGLLIANNQITFQLDTSATDAPNPYNSGGITLFSYGSVSNATIVGNHIRNSPVTCINIGGGNSADATMGIDTNILVTGNTLTDCGTLPTWSALNAAIWLRGTNASGALNNVQIYNNAITFTSNPFLGTYSIVGNPLTVTGGFVAQNPVTAAAGSPSLNIATAMSRAFPYGLLNAATGYQYQGAAPSGHFLRGNGADYVDGTIQYSDLPAAVAGCVVSYTTSTTAQASDNGCEVVLNGTSIVYTLPTGLTTGWHIVLRAVATSDSIALGSGASWWGSTSLPSLVPFTDVIIYDSGNNFTGTAPLVAGSGVSLTSTAGGGVVIANTRTTAVRAGTWSISAATSAAITFSTAMGSTPTSCSVTPTASAATTGTPFATGLSTTGFTVNVPTSGTLSGLYQCVLNNTY